MGKYTHIIPEGEISLGIRKLQGANFDFKSTALEVKYSEKSLENIFENKSDEDLRVYYLAAIISRLKEFAKIKPNWKDNLNFIFNVWRFNRPFVTLKEQWSLKLNLKKKFLMKIVEKDSSISYGTVSEFLENYSEYSQEIIKIGRLERVKSKSGLLIEDYVKLTHLINNDADANILRRFYANIKTRVLDVDILLDDFGENFGVSFSGNLNRRISEDITLSAATRASLLKKLLKETPFVLAPLKNISRRKKDKTVLRAKIISFEEPGLKFDEMKLSEEIPYARYNEPNGEIKIKLLKNNKLEKSLDLKNLSRGIFSQEDSNKIFVAVKISEKMTIKRFVSVTIDLGEMKIEVSSDYSKVAELLSKVTKALEIEVSEFVFSDISGEFVLTETNYDETTFAHLMMNDKLLSGAIFINESNTPQFLRATFRMGYKTEEEKIKTANSFVLANFTALEFTFVSVELGKILKRKKSGGNLLVRYSNAVNDRIIKEFENYMRSVLAYYETKRNETLKLYELVPEGKSSSGKPMTKIELLKERAPEVFAGGYGRICLLDRQPLIVDDDWAGEIMTYPRGNGYKFGCDGNTYPHPGLVRSSKNVKNFEDFKYLPCCFKLDQMNNIESKYNDYLLGREFENKSSDVIKSSNKIATGGEEINLPVVLSEFLKLVFSNSKSYTRLGVQGGNFHSAVATGSEKKLATFSFADDESINYKTWRTEDFKVWPSLLKQEMYDFTAKGIIKSLNGRTDFKSEIHYRLLEEIYSVNIFVILNNGDNFEFELPRNNYFHAREFRHDNSVIIFKTRKNSAPNENSYELIKSGDNYYLDKNETAKFVEIYEHINRTLTLSLTPRNKVTVTKYNSYYTNSVEENMLFQIIDINGKRRGFTTTNGMTIITPPSQPGNLPSTENITKVGFSEAVKYFGEDPVAVSVDENSAIVGVWFQPGVSGSNFYVPLNGNKINDGIFPLKVEHPLTLKHNKMEISNLKEIVKKIELVILTLYKHFNEENKTVTVTELFDKYVTIAGNADYSHGKWSYKILRNSTSIENIFNYLNEYSPKFVIGGKIRLYSRKFYDGLLYMVSAKAKSDRGRPVLVPKIEDRKNVSDGNLIFDNKAALDNYIQIELQKDVDVNKLHENVTPFHLGEIRPYILHGDGRNYLIQNVALGNKRRAYNVSKIWAETKVNSGFSTEEYSGAMLNYSIYLRQQAGDIFLREGEEKAGVKLLLDRGGFYSAMMSLENESF